ncbi:MAG: chemotaxis protein CheD [Lachnospiraceae bacterium]|nr:chemotaxis protein CheD [Lachnospiraceae bacterium]
MDKKITVGIADMKITRLEGTLITYALGSCIGIALYDPMIKLGALVHIMLPERREINDNNIFKYADSGIQETIRKMSVFGGVKSRLECKIAGGAKMFEFKSGGDLGNIGLRNSTSVKQVLMKEGIRLRAEDTGANYARTMTLDVMTGMVLVRTFGRTEISL